MKLNDYQQAAMATAVYPDYVGLAYTSLGLAGEAGELANKVKKVYRDNDGELTRHMQADIMDELGDTLWYVAALATEIGYDLDDVAAHNLEKLAARKARNAINGTGDKR